MQLKCGPLGNSHAQSERQDLEEPLFHAGGDVDHINVSVRVRSDSLEPASVTKLLGRAPTFSARKGERRASGGAEIVQSTGVWVFDLPESAEWELGDAIKSLLDQLPSELSIWQELKAHGTLEVFCGLHLSAWNRGAELPAALLTLLAERGLALQLDIYCSGPDDEK